MPLLQLLFNGSFLFEVIIFQDEKEDLKRVENKYTVKPSKDLRSKYEAKMEAKKQKEIEDKEQKIRDDELKRIAVCFHFTYVFKILLCVSRN